MTGEPTMTARDVATTLIRVAAGAVTIGATIIVCTATIDITSTLDSRSSNRLMQTILVTYVLRFAFGVSVFVGAEQIASWIGFPRPTPGDSPGVVWTPSSALRVGTALLGGWALFIACWPIGALIRAWTGYGVPPVGETYWSSPMRPDVHGDAISAALYVGVGALLAVGLRRVGQKAAVPLPPPPSADSSP